MKQSFFIDSTDGILKVFTDPEISKGPQLLKYGVENTQKAKDEWTSRLELAKKEAVKVDMDHKATELNIVAKILLTDMIPDKIYTVNMEDEIKIINQYRYNPWAPRKGWSEWIDCTYEDLEDGDISNYAYRKVARIISKKAEESEDELTQYIKRIQSQSFEGWTKDAQSGYLTACKSILEKHFEIKRKA